jgi:hypothetical protein
VPEAVGTTDAPALIKAAFASLMRSTACAMLRFCARPRSINAFNRWSRKLSHHAVLLLSTGLLEPDEAYLAGNAISARGAENDAHPARRTAVKTAASSAGVAGRRSRQ